MGNFSWWFKSRGIREEVVLEFIKDSSEKRAITILSAVAETVESLPSNYHGFDKAKASRIKKNK